jgi:VanZ family protein
MQYARNSVLKRLVPWLPAIAYMALIFYSSSQSDPAPVLTRNVWDKLLHAGGYGGLALAYLWALRRERWTWARIAITAIVLTGIYAATDEFHQRFTSGRFSDVGDWFADTVGGAITVALASVGKRLAGAQ